MSGTDALRPLTGSQGVFRLRAAPTERPPIAGPSPAPGRGRSLDMTAPAPHPMRMSPPENRHEVYTLLVEAGRAEGDGLPDGATGAALMCYAAGVDEAEAVRETVAILKQADLSVLEVSGYGALAEREAEGHDISAEDRALMERALAENAVIVAQITPFYDD